MAGIIGVVNNNSAFASFAVKEWHPWMTEAVLLHQSGVSIAELRIRFNKSDTHLGNIMRTEQAKEIVTRISRAAIQSATSGLQEKLQAAKILAVDNIVEALGNDDLKAAKPFDFWDHSRKSLETIERISAPAPVNNTNITQNILNVSPDILERLRAAPTMHSLPASTLHVDYIGPPPPSGRDEEELLGRGVHAVKSEGEDGPSVPLSGRPTP